MNSLRQWMDVLCEAADAPVGWFQTARGSTYDVYADGTTARIKAARDDPGHKGDYGAKQRSAKTVYLASTQQVQALAPTQTKCVIAELKPDTLSLITWNSMQNRWGVAPSARDVPVVKWPAVGLLPFELWDPDTLAVGNGLRVYTKLHAGNKIVQIGTTRPPSTGLTLSEHRVPLDFDTLYGRAFKVTDPQGDQQRSGFSIISRAANASVWDDWHERPQFKKLVKRKLNDPAFLADYKYQQIVDSARRLGLLESMLCEATMIAYHGTGGKFEQFHDHFMKPHFFTPDRDYALHYTGKLPLQLLSPRKRGRNYLLTVELTINHMFDPKTDAAALRLYNDEFVPHMNQIMTKYRRSLLPELATGHHVPFIYADDLWRYFQRFPSQYDGMLVDEGSLTDHPAVVPFQASQIKVLKRQIVKD